MMKAPIRGQGGHHQLLHDHEVDTSAGAGDNKEEYSMEGGQRSDPKKPTTLSLPLKPSLAGSTSLAD